MPFSASKTAPSKHISRPTEAYQSLDARQMLSDSPVRVARRFQAFAGVSVPVLGRWAPRRVHRTAGRATQSKPALAPKMSQGAGQRSKRRVRCKSCAGADLARLRRIRGRAAGQNAATSVLRGLRRRGHGRSGLRERVRVLSCGYIVGDYYQRPAPRLYLRSSTPPELRTADVRAKNRRTKCWLQPRGRE